MLHRSLSRLAAAAALAAAGACSLRAGRFALAVRRGLREARARHPYSRVREPDAPVMLLAGDSLAVGLGASSQVESVAGRLAADFPAVSIVNRSRSGARTAEVASQLRAAPLMGPVAAIWISAGGNDVLFNTPLPDLERHLRQALAAAHAKTDLVVVTAAANVGLAPLFFWPLDRVMSSRTRRVRDLFRRGCARSGAWFVDFFHEADDDPFSHEPQRFFGPDGLHPSSECYRHCHAEILACTPLRAALSRACAGVRSRPRAPGPAWALPRE